MTDHTDAQSSDLLPPDQCQSWIVKVSNERGKISERCPNKVHVGAYTHCLPCINRISDDMAEEDRKRREIEEKDEAQP